MLQTIIASLVAAAISGLAFLAVKHHAVYERLFGKLYVMLGFICLTLVAWSGAVSSVSSTLFAFVNPEKLASAKAAIKPISFNMAWILLGQFFGIAYLFFLSWLGRQIKEDARCADRDLRGRPRRTGNYMGLGAWRSS